MSEIIKEYRDIKLTIEQLRNVSKDFSEAVKDDRCDKKGIGFCLDNRFAAFKTNLSFDSWKGYYGNSGCSNVIYFQRSDKVVEYLIKYLNDNYTNIFKDIADRLEKENEDRKQKVKEALEEQIKELA